MLLNLLNKLGVKNVSFAGFDGRTNGKLNFIDNSFDRNIKNSTGTKVKRILNTAFTEISKTFITASEYH